MDRNPFVALSHENRKSRRSAIQRRLIVMRICIFNVQFITQMPTSESIIISQNSLSIWFAQLLLIDSFSYLQRNWRWITVKISFCAIIVVRSVGRIWLVCNRRRCRLRNFATRFQVTSGDANHSSADCRNRNGTQLISIFADFRLDVEQILDSKKSTCSYAPHR